MDNITKTNIDVYFKELKDKLDVENIKKHIESFSDDEAALEYFEDSLEDIGYILNDAEEYLGSVILALDEEE